MTRTMQRPRTVVIAAAMAVCIAASGTQVRSQPAALPSLTPSFGCTQPPTFDPTSVDFLAGDITSPFAQQADVNCFAWQSFIALN
ncbi:MAG: hypothetical protein JWM26_429 [Betaproteobacteria bacterium]|nr:hypothetical protein [Betaproteobacteria bacterium]